MLKTPAPPPPSVSYIWTHYQGCDTNTLFIQKPIKNEGNHSDSVSNSDSEGETPKKKKKKKKKKKDQEGLIKDKQPMTLELGALFDNLQVTHAHTHTPMHTQHTQVHMHTHTQHTHAHTHTHTHTQVKSTGSKKVVFSTGGGLAVNKAPPTSQVRTTRAELTGTKVRY